MTYFLKPVKQNIALLFVVASCLLGYTVRAQQRDNGFVMTELTAPVMNRYYDPNASINEDKKYKLNVFPISQELAERNESRYAQALFEEYYNKGGSAYMSYLKLRDCKVEEDGSILLVGQKNSTHMITLM